MKINELANLIDDWWYIATVLIGENSESSRRASINRIYYTILTCSRIALQAPLGAFHRKQKDIPKNISQLVKEDQRENIKSSFEQIYGLRAVSDYELLKPVTKRDYEECVYHARYIVNALVESGYWHRRLQ